VLTINLFNQMHWRRPLAPPMSVWP